ncbi:MAG: phosphonate metabolism transcriptional regulator PhnF [Pseudomonadota bacterium]
MTKTPVWSAIAAAVRGDIASGHYAPGAKLPTEAALAQRFGVNRHTVRRALAALAGDGLVYARRGSGVFVLSRPLDYPLSQRVRFHQNLMAAGRMPEKTVLSVEVRAAGADDARRLKTEAGDPIAVMHAVTFADAVPIALVESRFPEVRLPGLADALRRGGQVTAALAAVGVPDYVRASTRLSATTADAAQALHLKVREGAPLLLSQSINHDPNGAPAEYGQTWFASERITLTLDHREDTVA